MENVRERFATGGGVTIGAVVFVAYPPPRGYQGLEVSVVGVCRFAVALLPPAGHSRPLCSGPRYLVRSLSSCPRSHGLLGAMGWPQRQQVARPAWTIGSQCLRIFLWWYP